jgi:hypothetical protein
MKLELEAGCFDVPRLERDRFSRNSNHLLSLPPLKKSASKTAHYKQSSLGGQSRIPLEEGLRHRGVITRTQCSANPWTGLAGQPVFRQDRDLPFAEPWRERDCARNGSDCHTDTCLRDSSQGWVRAAQRQN